MIRCACLTITQTRATGASAPTWGAPPLLTPASVKFMPLAIPASDSTCMYANNDCMAIANTQWQDYLINRAVSAMKTTGVDGFFLDSLGLPDELAGRDVFGRRELHVTAMDCGGAALRGSFSRRDSSGQPQSRSDRHGREQLRPAPVSLGRRLGVGLGVGWGLHAEQRPFVGFAYSLRDAQSKLFRQRQQFGQRQSGYRVRAQSGARAFLVA